MPRYTFCIAERDGTCLTAEQKQTLGNIMTGAQTSTGAALYTSFPYDVGIGASGWASWEMSAAFSRDAGTVATVFSRRQSNSMTTILLPMQG